jgi:hypothetical protein
MCSRAWRAVARVLPASAWLPFLTCFGVMNSTVVQLIQEYMQTGILILPLALSLLEPLFKACFLTTASPHLIVSVFMRPQYPLTSW